VIKTIDCTVVCGHRGEEEQNAAYEAGNSLLMFPKSNHNVFPSNAIDLVPYIQFKGPTWENKQCYYFAGKVMMIARQMNIHIRCGADWDSDNDVNDQTLFDPCHFELIEEEDG